MTPERYSQVKSIFHLILDQPPDQRLQLLERACGRDRELLLAVRSLLASDAASNGFLDKSGVTPVSRLWEEASPGVTEELPKKIGPYAIEKLIGIGGMGYVYLATRADSQLSRQVAIKVIRRGLEQERIVQRFRQEREILASLDHPNISRLLDGGATEDGRLYFVMEYVEGQPIDIYCDSRRLNIEQRLKLFCEVCAAVNYAHQNLVIHRDLKPGNILVKADGTVKLLDFGIAKLLSSPGSTAAQNNTVTALRLLTPQYASPEQIRGETITTASDVYLLGLVLYELLCGHYPYETPEGITVEGLRNMAQSTPEPPSSALSRVELPSTNKEARPPRNPHTVSRMRGCTPRGLHRKLSGDLDAIVLRALKKESGDRYQSAAQFADDIRHFLAAEPVSAAPPRPWYRFWLFLKRNRVRAATGAIALLLVLIAAIIGGLQAKAAREEQVRAEARLAAAHRAATTPLFNLYADLPSLPLRRRVVQEIQAYLDAMPEGFHQAGPLQKEIANTRLQVARLQGGPNLESLGDPVGAYANYAQALRLLRTLPPDEEPQALMATALEGLAGIEDAMGDAPGALTHYREAQRIYESIGTPPSLLQHRTAVLLCKTNRCAEGLTLAQEAHQKALQAPQRTQALSYFLLGVVQQRAGELASAESNLTAGLTLASELKDRAFIEESLAYLLRQKKDPNAPFHLQHAIGILRGLAADPENIGARRELAHAYCRQGTPQSWKLAEVIFQEHLDCAPDNPVFLIDAAFLHQQRGEALMAQGQAALAAEAYRRSLQLIQRTKFPQLIAAAHLRLARSLAQAADQRNALPHAREALAIVDADLDSETPFARRNRALAHLLLGQILNSTGTPEAREHLSRAAKQFKDLAANHLLANEDLPFAAAAR